MSQSRATEYKRTMQNAMSYNEWYQAALALDKIEGNEEWKSGGIYVSIPAWRIRFEVGHRKRGHHLISKTGFRFSPGRGEIILSSFFQSISTAQTIHAGWNGPSP